jgi:23S rRNA-/tRNA-specific pseudouridylate synthase
LAGETDQYAVVNKPAGLDSQDSRADRPSLVGWLKERFGYAGLVHRLDFGTSGLVVCAKTPAAARALTTALQEGRIGRVYLAVVLGKILPDSGELAEPLDGDRALTRFRVLERFANATLVEVELETGRKHQIRRHFAGAGHPLLGDHLHGSKGSQLLFGRPALHAARLEVEGKVFEAPPPPDFEGLLARLRKSRGATRS